MAPRHLAAAVLVAVIWGFNFVVIKVGLQDMPPFLFSALRFAAAALPAVFLVGWPGCGWKPVVAVGVMLGVVKFGLLFVAIDVGVSAGLASLLLQAQVFFTIVLAALVHAERPSPPRLFGLAVGVCGMAVIGMQTGGNLTALGFALILGAALAWAVANLLMRRLGAINLLRFMVWMSLVPILPLLALSALIEGPARMAEAISGLTWLSIGAIAYIALAATVVGFALWGRLLSLYPAAQVTPFALLIPVAGMASGWLVLDETITPLQATGAGLVLAGLALSVLGDRLVRWVRPGVVG